MSLVSSVLCVRAPPFTITSAAAHLYLGGPAPGRSGRTAHAPHPIWHQASARGRMQQGGDQRSGAGSGWGEVLFQIVIPMMTMSSVMPGCSSAEQRLLWAAGLWLGLHRRKAAGWAVAALRWPGWALLSSHPPSHPAGPLTPTAPTPLICKNNIYWAVTVMLIQRRMLPSQLQWWCYLQSDMKYVIHGLGTSDWRLSSIWVMRKWWECPGWRYNSATSVTWYISEKPMVAWCKWLHPHGPELVLAAMLWPCSDPLLTMAQVEWVEIIEPRTKVGSSYITYYSLDHSN